MRLMSESIVDNEPIPPRHAFCVADPEHQAVYGENLNPGFSWSELPENTKSLVLLCHDSSAPSRPGNANKKGRRISAKQRRIDFFHWVLVDIRADAVGIQEGEFSHEVTPRGADGPAGPRGTRQGANDFSKWFAGDEEMEGTYFGYDGPCPPWNDPVVHQYHFTLHALSVERCPVGGAFTGPQVLAAIESYTLDHARLTGTYTLCLQQEVEIT